MFKGSITALITPFHDGELDREAFEFLVDWQIGEGVHGLVPCGTTGEAPTLSLEEHKWLVETAVRVAAGRVPVIAGCGSNSTAKAVAMARHAGEAGADGILVVTPYYNKPGPEGLFQHFKAVHDASQLPLIIYNIPGRSGIDMDVPTMARLNTELPNVVGVKDATGDLARVPVQRSTLGKDFCQLSGEDGTAVGFNALGGQGCISVTANIAPSLTSAIQEACLEGDYSMALELQDRVMPLNWAMFVEPNPAPAKFAASLIGICRDEVRLPLTALSREGRTLVASALSQAGIGPVRKAR
ncbi:MAG: 4-hydroxy-tetrahydrodipicolinate synthase [Sphingomonadales bacterium]